jgi:hypothetical protein
MRTAAALADLLEARGGVQGLDWGEAAWGLWTGAVTSYARPFTTGKLRLKGAEWQEFDDQELQERHDQFLRLRGKLYAHNDVMPHRTVMVVPPWDEHTPWIATESQAPFLTADIDGLRALCEFQIERMSEGIASRLAELFEGEQLQPGAIIALDDVPD